MPWNKETLERDILDIIATYLVAGSPLTAKDIARVLRNDKGYQTITPPTVKPSILSLETKGLIRRTNRHNGVQYPYDVWELVS